MWTLTDSDELVGDFGAVGLWLFNAGLWTQLSGVNADYVTSANLDGTGGKEIAGDFGATGLWLWNAGAWTQLSGVNADYVTAGNTRTGPEEWTWSAISGRRGYGCGAAAPGPNSVG